MERLAASDAVVRFGGLLALDGVAVGAPPGRVGGPTAPGRTHLRKGAA